MGIDTIKYKEIIEELKGKVQLVAASKTKTVEDIKQLYDLGQRDFGENYVQELTEKYEQLPKDIRWHFIGHLQSNKVKQIAPFVSLIHGVDSFKLLQEINKQGEKNNRVINCLLQIHIAQEETKFGLNEEELETLITRINTNNNEFNNAKICGFMGIASFTDDMQKVRSEFMNLKSIFDEFSKPGTCNLPARMIRSDGQPATLSMGMSADYKIAIEEGSNMVRIGSLIFGERS